MKKVLINIKDNKIIFSYKTNNSDIPEDLINTNIINDNELAFSVDYIEENFKILTSFMKELCLQYDVNQIVVSKLSLAPLIVSLLSKCEDIKELYIKDENPLTYEVCEKLIAVKNIKNVNCELAHGFMVDLLDKNNIKCTMRTEILFISNFMDQNELISYSDIYYKNSIKVTLPLALEDIKDFEEFCKANKYLKTIHINKLIIKELEKVISILIKYNKNNLKVIIHENVNDEKTVNELKEINKIYKKEYKIYLSLEYTKEYLDNNLFKQAIVNTLKICGLIISSLVVLVITYIGVSNYVALKQVTSIKEELQNIVENTDTTKIIEEKNKENEQNAIDKAEQEEKPIEKVKPITNEALAALLTKNEDVIGELKVNNTNIDYPVVQAIDNEFYLKHNINKEKNANGWIFMDYRNNSMNLDRNNIIYGHNMYYSGVMFGTLHKTANKSWYTNKENQIITYNTLYENMQFKIISIYRIPKTSDYLKVHFKDDYEFLEFVDLITKRSYYNFNVPVSTNDKILTLSTCSNNGTKRLVIHAILITEENKSQIINE